MKVPSASLLGLSFSLSFGMIACDDPKPTTSTGTAAATQKPAPTTAPTEKKLEEISITVDDMGPYVGGERAKLAEPGGDEKLKAAVAKLPIGGKQVEVTTLKKARTSDVVALVKALGEAGAPTVKVKTNGRDDLPKELILVPQKKLTEKPAACAIVVMVNKELATNVWTISGGMGKRHAKGFAGPDLSNTSETLKKTIPKCDSSVAFLSSDGALDWELTHNLGGTLLNSDEEKKLKTLVLLDEPPVGGRPVKLDP